MDADRAQQVHGDAELLFDAASVDQAIAALAAAVEAECREDFPLLLCVMNGGLLVTAELLKRLPVDLRLDYIHATRYREQVVGSGIYWRVVPAQSLEGRSVVVVDDIFDEGITLSAIVDYCRQRGASSVTSVVLVDKCHARKVAGFSPDIVGLRLPDRYLYGFGMDYKGYLRNCSEIYAVRE